MPSQIEGMIQNMIQAGIPHAQMMQFLQQSLHQAAGASPSPAISHNNAGGAQSTAAQQAAAAVVAAHQAAQAAAHQQHFQPPSVAAHPQHQSAASTVAQNAGAASGVGPTGGAGAGVGQQQHAASNGGTGAALGPAGVAASLQHLASLQQQQQLLAAHHQHQHPHNPAVAASVHQAHAAAGQPTSAALQASSLMQMAAAHPHHQPAAGLAAMQQQLQQTAAAGATHPMAAAFAQAQLAAAAAQQQQHAVANTGTAVGAGLSTGLSGVAAANLQQQHVQQLASSVAQNAAAAQQTAPPLAIPSLAWPIFQPIVNIPYFDMATYQKVNLDVQPSAMANGMDLPLNDINTLRFFFNFGVQHARAILLRQHINSQAANQQQQQQQQHQQHQLALLQQQNQLTGNAAANNGAQQGSQELNSANEQLQIQQKLLVHQSLLNQMPMGSMPNENCAQFNSGGTPTIGGTAFRSGGGGIMQIGQGGQFSGGGSVGQMMENSGGEKQTQQILLMNNGQTIGIGGAPSTVMNQQQQQMATMIGGTGGLNALGQSPLMGMGGEEGGNGEMTKGGNCGGMGKGQGNNNSNVGNKKSVNTIGQQLQERAQNDAAAVAAAAAAIEKSTGNSMANAAGSGAAQLLQGGMAGLAGLQNPLQMNQLAAMMANQQGAGQQAKIGNLNSGEVNDLGAGGASAVAQQLRMAQSNNPQQAQLAAMQQLLIQQQQQQLAAALAQQQQQNEQDQQQNQQQTGNELGRTQLISNNTSSVGGTPTNSTPSTQIPNNQSGQFGINSGGGSANGTPQSTGGGGGNNGGRGSVNGQQMTNSVSPKNGAVVPTDPAPRKPPSAQIVANPLNAELNDLKQRGLNALRSPEAMNEGLQKRIVEMANTLNTVSMGAVAVGGGGNGGNGGNGSSGIISLGGGPGGCAGAQLPPAILLQQQQQIYQQQQQLLQQHLLQQQLLQAQSAPPQQPPQSQQLSMAAQLSAALANNFVTPNGAQPQRQTNLPQNVHAENDSAPALLSATEMHYTETFKNNQQQDGMKRKQMRPTDLAGMAPELEIGAGLSQRRKSGVYMLNNMNAKEERKTPITSSGGGTGAAPSQPGNAANPAASTAVSTSAMMNFMNNMLTTAKSHLQGQGLGLYYDQNGNPIDYSSRPIDPIFRKAREDLSHSPGATVNGGTLVQGGVKEEPMGEQNGNELVDNKSNEDASAGTTSASGQPSMAQIPAETQTTSAVGGDLGFLSRTCLIGISDGRRGSVGNAQQLTAQQPVPLNALYSGNLTPQQLQQHYLQLQQQQQQLQQLQQIQQLQQQIQQQQNEQFQQQGNDESAENGKKRALDGTMEEGAPSAKSSRVDSDIEIVQETYKTPRGTESSSHQNQIDQMATPQNQPPSSSDGHPPEQNIPPFTAPEELNNATVIDSGTIGGEENQQQGMEREEEDEERAGGNEGNGIEQQQEREEEDGGSPASGKQLRIAEEEEDGP